MPGLISKRSFLKRMLLGATAFAILPPAETYNRMWRAQRQVTKIYCGDFMQALLRAPRYDELILKEFSPMDSWIESADCGIFQEFSGDFKVVIPRLSS